MNRSCYGINKVVKLLVPLFTRIFISLTNIVFSCLDLNSTLWWTKGGGYKGSNACNMLEGTDGQQFHPDLQDNEKLWIFSTDLCRSMFLTYQV